MKIHRHPVARASVRRRNLSARFPLGPALTNGGSYSQPHYAITGQAPGEHHQDAAVAGGQESKS